MNPAGVVITGASTGIGEACALRLDRLGYQVFAGVRRPEDGERLQAGSSARLHPVHLDIADAESIRAAAEQVARSLGGNPLGGLVNNAGIAVAAPVEFLPLDALRRQLEVNVVGQVAVTQALLPLLRPGRGRIVNMSSVSGRIANPFLGAYSASKFALEALSDALRVELAPWGMHVALVEPGVIQTPIWNKSLAAADALQAGMPPEAHRLYGAAVESLRTSVTQLHGLPPERVADVVVHALAARRPKARYVVGRDARLGVLLSHLPAAVRDRLIGRRLRGVEG